MSARLIVDLILHVTVTNLRHRFGPGKAGTPACAVNRRLARGVEQMHPLITFATLARILVCMTMQ
jgi:hypothetical protein